MKLSQFRKSVRYARNVIVPVTINDVTMNVPVQKSALLELLSDADKTADYPGYLDTSGPAPTFFLANSRG
jgi:hypothetical protein